jgi:hypothetical protein
MPPRWLLVHTPGHRAAPVASLEDWDSCTGVPHAAAADRGSAVAPWHGLPPRAPKAVTTVKPPRSTSSWAAPQLRLPIGKTPNRQAAKRPGSLLSASRWLFTGWMARLETLVASQKRAGEETGEWGTFNCDLPVQSVWHSLKSRTTVLHALCTAESTRCGVQASAILLDLSFQRRHSCRQLPSAPGQLERALS